jgi:hypothetical protein
MLVLSQMGIVFGAGLSVGLVIFLFARFWPTR